MIVAQSQLRPPARAAAQELLGYNDFDHSPESPAVEDGMMDNEAHRSVALLQVPFASHNSVSLGPVRIKSTLAAEGFDCHIKYLDHELEALLGEEVACDFQRARDSYWLMELVYAAELFPDYLDTATFLKRASTLTRGASLPVTGPTPKSLLEIVREFNRRTITDWQRSFPYDVVGISCNYNLMPALYFASAIKKLHPRVQVVLGGSQVGGEVGYAVMKTFPFVDWVVRGEGEAAVVNLMRALNEGSADVPPSCCRRLGPDVVYNGRQEGRVDMELLPLPDFDDFLESYRRHRFARAIQLPLEIGRGCYYGKCGFCGFNPLGVSYRRMSDSRVRETLEHLVARYGISRFVFVDNLIPPNVHALAKSISESPYQYDFFLALQAVQAPRVIDALVQMGTREAFIGIESLATSVLRRMHKGSTLLDNIVALKETVRRGIAAPYFLLTQFPGETKEEIEQSVRINRLIAHLNMDALDSPFYIHYGCPPQQSPQAFGLRRIFPHKRYRWLLPPEYRFSPTYFWDFEPKLRRKRIMRPRAESEAVPRLELLDRGPAASFVIDTRSRYKEYPVTAEEYRALRAFDRPKAHTDAGCSDRTLKRLIRKGLLVEDSGKCVSLAIVRQEEQTSTSGEETQSATQPPPADSAAELVQIAS
jgi:ribosomal peptide maturation radical SAM protein 1